MGVRINDTDFTWDGPDGLRGTVTGKQAKGGGKGKERRDGDWDCPECGKMVFASKDSCFSCGAPKPRGGSRGYDRGDRGDRDYGDRGDRGGRRSSRDDDRYDRRR